MRQTRIDTSRTRLDKVQFSGKRFTDDGANKPSARSDIEVNDKEVSDGSEKAPFKIWSVMVFCVHICM